MRSTATQQQIGDLIDYWGRYYNVSPRLARAVFTQESSLDPNVPDGTSGEKGIAQLMPGTAGELGVTDPYDPNQSIRGGVQYLRQGLDTALASNHPNPAAYAVRYYNGGPSGPRRHATDQYVAGVAKNYAGLPDDQPATAPAPAPTAGAVAGPQIWDVAEQAGFGHKFGDFEQPPTGMIIHHTGGGGDVNSVLQTYKDRNFPAQFVIDRNGTIFQTLPDGAKGQHIMNGWGPVGTGKSNDNMEGVEVIARDDKDVLPVQQQAAAALLAARAQKWGYNPQISVFGHGEVNPGHKEPDEGMTIVSGIRNGTLPLPTLSTAVASTKPVQTASAGVGDVEPALARAPAHEANVSDPSRPTPNGSTGPLPTNWAQVPGAPASMAVAPPSMFTASSPEQQARWNAVSTPQGYEQAVRELAGSGAAGPAPVTPVTRTPLPPGRPDLSQVQEDPARSVPTVMPPPPQPGIAQLEALGRGQTSPAAMGFGPGAQGTPMPAQPPAAGAARSLSDEQVAKMGPEDVFGVVTNQNLTDADRQALNARLIELQQQQSGSQ